MKYVYERTIGYRNIMNTDHPVKIVVYRGVKRSWILATICNGKNEMNPRYFTTKHEAIAEASKA